MEEKLQALMDDLKRKVKMGYAPSIRTRTKYNSTRKSVSVTTNKEYEVFETLTHKAREALAIKDVQDFDLVEATLYYHPSVRQGWPGTWELYFAFNALDNQLALW